MNVPDASYGTALTTFATTRFRGPGCRTCQVSVVTLVIATLMVVSSGCSSLWGKSDRPGDPGDGNTLKDLLQVPEPPDLVREAAVPSGMKFVRVEGVGVVNALPGSGGPAQPSALREMLMEEMKHNDIPNPNQYLERADTALVQVHSIVPPGARRGDPLDVTLRTPVQTEAVDLHGGWLLDTRLRYQQRLGGTTRSSEVMSIGTGEVLTRFDREGRDDEANRVQGMVLSGGTVQVDRKLGLVLRPDFSHVKMASAIAAAINRRFYFYDGTTRRGIAKAIEDDFIEIEVHPRYRGNEFRLMEVIRALGVAPESSATQTRLVQLGERLRDVETAADAALQLEGLGEGAIPTLLDAIEHADAERRFYAAEALAYLDRHESIEPLISSIRHDRAFRAPAFDALRGLQHHDVAPALADLLHDDSLETRYGAFDTLRRREDPSPSITGQRLNGSFSLYQLESRAPAAVVLSLRRRPEVVLLGSPRPLKIESFLRGPGGLLIRQSDTPGKLRLSRFQPGQDDARIEVDATLPGVISGIARVGGGYGDVVALLRSAKTNGILPDQLAMDPLPEHHRQYYRDDDSSDRDFDASPANDD
ncbi:MAG: flagellar basal body P-ring protein FlgI [Planctomycetota bacterium]